MSCTIDDWEATAAGAGSTRVITVKGRGECTQGGHQLRLEPTNEGVIDDPNVTALRLVIEEPEVGTDLMTPVEVKAEVHGDPAIRVRIDTTEGSEWVDVVEG